MDAGCCFCAYSFKRRNVGNEIRGFSSIKKAKDAYYVIGCYNIGPRDLFCVALEKTEINQLVVVIFGCLYYFLRWQYKVVEVGLNFLLFTVCLKQNNFPREISNKKKLDGFYCNIFSAFI